MLRQLRHEAVRLEGHNICI